MTWPLRLTYAFLALALLFAFAAEDGALMLLLVMIFCVFMALFDTERQKR